MLVHLKRLALPLVVAITLTLGSAQVGYGTAPGRTGESASGAAAVAAVAETITVTGVDLHDGTVAKFGSTYYLYGTMYGCGFRWQVAGTPWCGFGVSTATSLRGPWSAPRRLFSPSDMNSFRLTTWQQTCGGTGAGCFNPRMLRRTWGPNDGVFILWFNAPSDYAQSGANAYYAMGCNGPEGPCGDGAGPPYGSTTKPRLTICGGNGDFSIVTNGSAAPQLFCTNADQTFSQEQLDTWGTNGTGTGTRNLAGLRNVESPGAYRDQATGKWLMTFSDPNCGYCAGTGTSYATADSLSGPWTAPPNTGYSPAVAGRRAISATSCGGQPRTVFTVDGRTYQWIDLWGRWNGDSANQARAGVVFAELSYTPQPAPNGGVLPPQFAQWPCA
ncbi:hypothetical protein ABGB07_28135 [Micromonosporaceae bacterium B7E4]